MSVDNTRVPCNARLKNRARIETSWDALTAGNLLVTPGLKTGRGLKRMRRRSTLLKINVTPGLKTGRGLNR